MQLRIGTSGWNYPSGRGTWNGMFYPPPEDRDAGLRRAALLRRAVQHRRGEQHLLWPAPRGRGPGLGARGRPPRLRVRGEAVPEVHAPRDGGRPLARSRRPTSTRSRAASSRWPRPARLGALLAQFPPRFHHTPEARDYLEWLLRTFAGYPMAVELRHRTWSDAAADTRALLDAHGAAWVQIDEPKFESSIEQDLTPNAQRRALRAAARPQRRPVVGARPGRGPLQLPVFGGRSWSRLPPGCAPAARAVKKVYLFLNNHFSAQAVANATMLKRMLGDPVTARMPARARGALPRRWRGSWLLCPPHGYSDDAVGDARSSPTTSMPEITLPNTV